MEKTTYNLDAKIKIYDERFKYIFDKLKELLNEDNVTPGYVDDLKRDIAQLQKDLVSIQIGGNTTIIKHLEDIYKEVLRLHDQLQNQITEDKTECHDYQTQMNTQLRKTYEYCKDQIKSFKTYLTSQLNTLANGIQQCSTKDTELSNKIDSSKEELNIRIDNLDNNVTQRINNFNGVLQTNTDTLRREISDGDNSVRDKITNVETTLLSTKADVNSLGIKQTELETKVNNISFDPMVIDTKIESAKQDLEGKINSSKLELTTTINDYKAECNTKFNTYDNIKPEIESEIDNVKSEFNSNIDLIKSEFNSDMNVVKQTIVNDMSMLQNDLDQKIVDLITGKIYPIGSIFVNALNTDPNTILGTSFTWRKIEDGTKLLASTINDVNIREEGTNQTSFNHNHRTDFQLGYTNGMPNLWAEGNNFGYGLAKSYDANNNPTSWSYDGSHVMNSIRWHAPSGTTSGGTSVVVGNCWRMTGVTGNSSATVDVTGKVLKVNIWLRIA